MNIDEMHIAFRIGLDKTTSGSYPDFLPEEIDYWLNIATREFVKTRYSGANSKQEAFEQTQKRTEDLKTLVKNTLIEMNSVSKCRSYAYQDYVCRFDIGNRVNSYLGFLPIKQKIINTENGIRHVRPMWIVLNESTCLEIPTGGVYSYDINMPPMFNYSQGGVIIKATFTKNSNVVTGDMSGFNLLQGYMSTGLWVILDNDFYNGKFKNISKVNSINSSTEIILEEKYKGEGGVGYMFYYSNATYPINIPDNTITNKRFPVKDSDLNRFSMDFEDPLGEHVLQYGYARPIRLFRDNMVELVTDGNYIPVYYDLTYLAKPMTVNSLTNTTTSIEEEKVYKVTGGSIKYDNCLYNQNEYFIGVRGVGTYSTQSGTPVITMQKVDSDMPEHTHDEIVNIAVTKALSNIESPRYQQNLIETLKQE
jgi:hypothetical protein